MFVSIDASAVLALGRDLQDVDNEVIPRVQRAVVRNGFKVVATAQVLAPVDTGNLKNTIGVDIDMLSYVAGPTANYGGFVEQGTTGPYPIDNAFGRGFTVMHPGISPQPYMGPAFDRHLPSFVKDVGDAGEDIL